MAQGFENLEEAKPSEVDDADAMADPFSTEGSKDIKLSQTEPLCIGDTNNIGHDVAISKDKKTKNLTILPPQLPFTNESDLHFLTGCHKLPNLPHFLQRLKDSDLSDREDGLPTSLSYAVKRDNISYVGLEELETLAVSLHENEENREPSLHLLQNSLFKDNNWKDNPLIHFFATSSSRFAPGIDTQLMVENTVKKYLLKKMKEGTDIFKEMRTLSRVQHQNVESLMGSFHTNSKIWLMFNSNGVSLPLYTTEHQDFPRDLLELGQVFGGILLGTKALHEKGIEYWNLDPAHLCYDGSTIKITGITDNFPNFGTEPEGMYVSPETARYILLHSRFVSDKEQLMCRINPSDQQHIPVLSHIYLSALVYMYIQSGHHPLVDIATGGKDWEKFVRRQRDVLSHQLLQMVAALPDILKQSLEKIVNRYSGLFQDLLQQMLSFEANQRPTPTHALKKIKEILDQLIRNSHGNEVAGPTFCLNRAHNRESLFEEQEGHSAVRINENHFLESKKDKTHLHHGSIQQGQQHKFSNPTQRRSIQTCGNLPHFSLLFNKEPT